MKAALLLLGLCGLAAASATAPAAEDVRVTGRVPPMNPVGERCLSRPDTVIVSILDKSSASTAISSDAIAALCWALDILHLLLYGGVVGIRPVLGNRRS